MTHLLCCCTVTRLRGRWRRDNFEREKEVMQRAPSRSQRRRCALPLVTQMEHRRRWDSLCEWWGHIATEAGLTASSGTRFNWRMALGLLWGPVMRDLPSFFSILKYKSTMALQRGELSENVNARWGWPKLDFQWYKWLFNMCLCACLKASDCTFVVKMYVCNPCMRVSTTAWWRQALQLTGYKSKWDLRNCMSSQLFIKDNSSEK